MVKAYWALGLPKGAVMTRFTWFRLVIRLLGVTLIGMSIPDVVGALSQITYDLFAPTPGMNYLWLTGLVSPFVQLTFGLYLLFGGNWIVAHCLKGIDTTCPACGYDLTGSAHENCPECGFRALERTAEATSQGGRSIAVTGTP